MKPHIQLHIVPHTNESIIKDVAPKIITYFYPHSYSTCLIICKFHIFSYFFSLCQIHLLFYFTMGRTRYIQHSHTFITLCLNSSLISNIDYHDYG